MISAHWARIIVMIIGLTLGFAKQTRNKSALNGKPAPLCEAEIGKIKGFGLSASRGWMAVSARPNVPATP